MATVIGREPAPSTKLSPEKSICENGFATAKELIPRDAKDLPQDSLPREIDRPSVHAAADAGPSAPSLGAPAGAEGTARVEPPLGTHGPSRTAPAAGPVLQSQYQLGSPEWKQEFGTQVSFLVSRREPQAELRLSPAELGPVQVRIGLQGDQVSVAFAAPQSETRAAIENAIPQLREMLASNGLALGQASVNAGSSDQRGHGDPVPGQSTRSDERAVTPEQPMAVRHASVQLVDTFA